jgi:hypothetical protein
VIALLLVLLFGSPVIEFGELAGAAQQKLESWLEPPYGACRFVQDQFGATPDTWQEQLLVAAMDPGKPRISLQACAGPGKTCGLAWVAGWFLGTRVTWDVSGWELPNGLATSITGDNLKDNLWKEIAKWQARSDYLRSQFVWTSQRIFHRNHQATWFLAARNWPKSGTSDEQGRTFSGLHGKNVLVLIDESGAIPPTIMRAAEQALPNTHFGKVIQAGNPISHEGMLYEAANLRRHLWHIIVVTGDPDDPHAWVNNPRVSRDVQPGQQSPADMNREQIATYGRDNPWVMSYILGKFPPQSINALLSLEDVLAAEQRDPQPEVYAHVQKRIGVDVARFGDDRTVLWARQGAKSWKPVVLRGADTNEIVARVLMGAQRFQSELTLVDNSFAWGNGVVDNLRHTNHRVHPVNFAGKAIDPRYKNRRAEGWLEMAKAIKERGHNLPANVPELHAELTTPTYTFANGVFLLEEKDQVKKRLGRSPDLADALAITYMLPDQPSRLALPGTLLHQPGTHGRAATEYDELERA